MHLGPEELWGLAQLLLAAAAFVTACRKHSDDSDDSKE